MPSLDMQPANLQCEMLSMRKHGQTSNVAHLRWKIQQSHGWCAQSEIRAWLATAVAHNSIAKPQQ